MNSSALFTSLCGLCCKDCIPGNKEFFKALRNFEKILSDLDFKAYARLKSQKVGSFRDYPKFANLLQEIKKLECTTPCSLGGKPDCQIRACVLLKDYDGCWECGNFKSCKLLQPLKKAHPSLLRNHKMIRRFGMEKWNSKRGKHYTFSK